MSRYRVSKMRNGRGPPGNNTVLRGNNGRAWTLADAPGVSERDMPSDRLPHASEGREQLTVQAAEAAVAHDQHVIAGPGGACQLLRQGVDVVSGMAAAAERSDDGRRVPAQVRGGVQPGLVGTREGWRECAAMHPHL